MNNNLFKNPCFAYYTDIATKSTEKMFRKGLIVRVLTYQSPPQHHHADQTEQLHDEYRVDSEGLQNGFVVVGEGLLDKGDKLEIFLFLLLFLSRKHYRNTLIDSTLGHKL